MTSSSPATETLDIAVLEMRSDESPHRNLNQIRSLIKNFSSTNSPDWICLPENSLYNKICTKTKGLPISDPIFDELVSLSRELNTCFHLGALPLAENNKVYNATLLINPEKEQPLVVYKKIHLFDLELKGLKIKESAEFSPGITPSTYTYRGWKFGFAICYDLRFPELFYYYAQEKVDILFTPAAFTVPTGKAHWDYLTTARAIECQSYVVAAGQTGTVSKNGKSRSSHGHSVIIDPWGEKLSQGQGPEPKLLRAILNKEKISSVRKSMPISEHRRLRTSWIDLEKNEN